MQTEKTVIVIGGGITGLSAAYYLQRKAKEAGRPIRILLFERDEKFGGKIETERVDGFVIEKGPDSFLARKGAALELARELGLEDEVVGTDPRNKKTYILHKGKLHRIPAGLNVGIPTQFVPFATTGLLSLGGKIRAAMDLFLPKSKHTGDQSLGGFLARRLGDEVVDQMAEPLLAGIYAGNSRNLSLRATFPHLETLEQKHGSLIRGMLEQAKHAKAAQQAGSSNVEADRAQAGSTPETGGQPSANAGETAKKKLPNTMFLSFRRGLRQYVDSLTEVLGPEILHASRSVREIKRLTDDAAPGKWQVLLDNGEMVEADGVVLTTPTFDTARFLPRSFEPAKTLEKIPYASVATVILAYSAESISFPLDGTGFVVPKGEGRTITACTWISSKWMHTAPKDKVLIRCYVGRAGDEAIVDEEDETILQKVRVDLQETMGITADPLFTRITRWRHAMPQYTVGHLDRLKNFEDEARAQYPGLFFAGAGFTGLGVPDCIQQGKHAAEETIRYLQSHE